MPIYDRICDCGWAKEDCYEPRDFTLACPSCGAETKRQWTRMTVIPDTFTTPVVDENMARDPYVHYSRSERKARMRHHGLLDGCQHVGAQGSDKNKHTSRWV